MKNYQFILTLIFFAMTFPLSALAQSSNDEEADHPALSRFPQSEIVSFNASESVNYLFVMGSLQKPRYQVEAEEFRRVSGHLTKITYEISQQFSGADVIEFFRQQVQQRGYNPLFSCDGRACGSSEYWANDIFNNRILYGPERNQYYLALETATEAESKTYISVYVTTRANRRSYAHLEFLDTGTRAHLETGVIDSVSFSSTLRAQRSVVLPQLEFNQLDQLQDDTALQIVAQAMALDTNLSLYIVGHLRDGSPLAAALEKSQTRADLVRTRLLNMGVAADRLVARGVGPLAPICSQGNCAQRIEFVLQ